MRSAALSPLSPAPQRARRWTSLVKSFDSWSYRGELKGVSGFGGRIEFTVPIPAINSMCSHRIQNLPGQFSPGEKMFLRHLVMAVLDRHFMAEGRYRRPHIAAPLGSYRFGYYYRFFEGSEGFPWEFCGEHVTLPEFNAFTTSFESFGFGVRSDITNPDDGWVSQNIICAAGDDWIKTNVMPAEWVRIDIISGRSCPFRREEYLRRVREQETALTRTLGADGYQLLSLYPEASAVLRELAGRERMKMLARENFIHA